MEINYYTVSDECDIIKSLLAERVILTKGSL